MKWIGVFVLLLFGLVLVLLGYGESWTGFSSAPIKADHTSKKLLWDWLDLLLVPLILVLGAFFLENSRRKSELDTEADNQRQVILDNYFEKVFHVVSETNESILEISQTNRYLIRSRTLSALRQLDGHRKAVVLQFLYELGLIGKDPVIVLNGADFTNSYLDNCTLMSCELRGGDFSGSSIREANLRGADLCACNFTNVDFSKTDMTGSNLEQSIIVKAIFDGVEGKQFCVCKC